MKELAKTDQYDTWLRRLKDIQGRARISARVARLLEGNPGQHRVLTGGVCEMKVDVGPGYRVYYTERNQVLVILLCGGDKSTQAEDIKLALQLAKGV
ncbi:type II toxin-antitoxin system RelE/ParE family toxin [Sinimarinibacterium sp. NLF-5-8]|uniref:type II toxin-antitoxin system RelE/ParE family toxin n=1 Tax=Sinimarinibacterium sp. NLF-5-8 TaxID=2698684 RepID=UPI00137C16F4|nr:type II toxin-antitoxin system RelE/ParE family toxin [Sinimarinibacterium sp. NLF-5-8]QHS10757.1 type II toxin-antitoxin system RelE/ParE family toxin [Sinimarinibacterium sp. NLF-5-8]